MSFPLRALALLPLLLCAGCFEYEESVWVAADGTGRLRADLRAPCDEELPEDELADLRATLELARKAIAAKPEVSKVELALAREDGAYRLLLDLAVHDFRDLGKVVGGDALPEWLVLRASDGPPLRFVELADGRVRFVRDLGAGASARARARLPQRLAARVARVAAARRASAAQAGAQALGEDEPRLRFRLHAARLHSVSAPGVIEGSFWGGASALWELAAGGPPPGSLEAELQPTRGLLGVALPAAGGLALLGGALWLRSVWRRGLLRRFLARRGVL